MRIFRFRLSNAIFLCSVALLWMVLLAWIIFEMIRGRSYTRFPDQVQIAFFLFGIVALIYSCIYFLYFKIATDEDKIQMCKPLPPWDSQEQLTLKWGDIESLELEPFILFLESKRYILKPKKDSGKKPIKFTNALENFPELTELILRNVTASSLAKSAIEYDVQHLSRKWPLSIGWTIAFVLIVIVVAIHLTSTVLHWPR